MKFGVFHFASEETMSTVALGRALEERGFESLFLGEHTHIPVSRESAWPGGAAMPRYYPRGLDPFVTLGAVATTTARLRLGTGVCLVTEHHPIGLAKQVATLDYVSNGRFLFGVGGGWNLEEMKNHGIDPSRRFTRLRERILAMKQIWTQDEASFHGETVHFDPIWQWPKPVQKPHPPIIVGGEGSGVLRRVADYGDGWMPIVRKATGEMDDLRDRIAELNRLAQARGRGPIEVSAWHARPKPEAIEEYRAAGVSRCIFPLPIAGEDEVLKALDGLAPLVAEFGEPPGA